MVSAIERAGVSQKSNHRLIVLSSLLLILPLVFVSALSVLAETSNSVPAKNELFKTYGRLPLSFEANHGQTDEQVKFLSRGRGYSLFLTPSEAVLALRKAEGKGQQAAEKKNDPALSTQNSELSSVVRMKLTGANSQARVVGISELPGKVNYFIGSDPAKWRTNVPTYAKVKYTGVYPGVDVVYYGNQGQLEYDFIVAPGADPKSIALTFEGAEKLALDEKGDLVFLIAGAELRLRKPLVYQEIGGVRKEISAAYILKPGAETLNPKSKIANPKSEVGFQLAAYDASKPLIIDPVLVYSTYLGGSGDDAGNSIAVDGSGNAYVTGRTASSSFPFTAGAYDTGFNGVADVFVAKLNAAGSALLYSTYLGGSDDDSGNGIAVDGSGNAYVTGKTNSSNFPVLNAVQAKKSGSASAFDAFVTKLNAAGSGLVYSTYLGGSSDDAGNGIALESSSTGCTLGCVYVVGFTKSTNFPIKNALRGKSGGVTDVFVAKLSFTPSPKPLLDLVYATYLGGSGDDTGNAIDVDDSGNAYITGETVSSNFPTTTGAFDPSFNGVVDAFVAKLNSTGSALLYSTYLGGSGADRGRGIAIDGSGNAYVTGGTLSSNFPVDDAFQASLAAGDNGGDAFVTKLNAAGSALVYSTYLGGTGADVGNGITVDASGNAYVTGSTTSAATFPTTTGPLGAGGGQDAFVTNLGSLGSNLVYSIKLGGGGADQGFAIALDTSLNAYVTGSTASSTGFPIASFQPAFGGGTSDAFVTKLAAQTPPVLAGVPATAIINELATYSFTATATDSDTPAQTLTFSLVGAPTGASIGPSTGVFSWMPGEAQGPSNYTFKVRVTDDGSPALFSEKSITITVNEVNSAPVLSNVPATATINELVLFSFTASATDADIPVQTLTFSLVGAPAGATIGASSGIFNWTPTEAQGPGVYPFTVRVSDGVANTNASITITVNPVNAKPTANNQNVNTSEDTSKLITLSGSDTETAAANLTFKITGLPSPSKGKLYKGNSTNTADEITAVPTTLSGNQVTYKPNDNFNGADSFKFKATDRGDPDNCGAPSATCAAALDSDEATVSITITPVNDVPVANAQSIAANDPDGDGVSSPTTLIVLTGSDIDADPLTFKVASLPASGKLFKGNSTNPADEITVAALPFTLPAGGTQVTYQQPSATFKGSVSFTFKVNDGTTDSNTATVSITAVNGIDNCPLTSNPLQTDTDRDGTGDACDTDADADGILDKVAGTTPGSFDPIPASAGGDNCPLIYNPDQADQDGDGVGDACDNCPINSNANQADSNGDGLGDVCAADYLESLSLAISATQPGAPLVATATFRYTGSEASISTINPDCFNTTFTLKDAGNNIVQPHYRSQRAYGVPDDVTAIPNGQPFSVSCDLSEIFDLTPGTYKALANYANYTLDPDIIGGVCTSEPSAPCVDLWIGSVSSDPANPATIVVAGDPVMRVEIDIKPNSFPNSVNCGNPNENVPVAVLSSADFDATTINAATVRFGKTGTSTEASETHNTGHLQDVNGDGLMDMLFHFRFGDTGFNCVDTTVTAVLQGQTTGGTSFADTDSLRMVPK